MNQDRWQQIESLYHSALELLEAERAMYLTHACADDAELRAEVESLLAEAEQEDSFLNKPAMTLGLSLLADSEAESLSGQQFGAYKILERLGRGGMGDVYLAEDPRLERLIALKLLPAYLTEAPDSIQRFRQEARAASAISHPNVAHIYETGVEHGRHYLAMEYIEGLTLRQLLKRERPTLLAAIEIALQVANALGAAHEVGVVHRDIKPENIMVRGDGYAKVLDFGLAKLSEARGQSGARRVSSGSSLDTTPGMIMGTTPYMSPEQARGQVLDARTDIWSVGVVLYEMLAGRKPFEGETPSDISAAILLKDPPPLEVGDSVQPILETIVSTALHKNPAERYQTAQDLARDLKRARRELEFIERWQAPSDSSLPAANLEAQSARAELNLSSATLDSSSARAGTTDWWDRQSQLMRTILTASVIGLLTFIMGGAVKYFSDSRSAARSAQPAAPANQPNKFTSLAVLPFANESGDEKLDYLSEGLAEDLIRDFGQNTALRVIALSSARKVAKETRDEQIKRMLGVGAVLRGKVRLQDNQIVIEAQLIDANTGSIIWQDTYSTPPAQLLKLRNTMTVLLFTNLQGLLGEDKRIILSEYPTINNDAYKAYLAGKYARDRYDVAGSKRAVASLEKAVALDPRYSLAYVALADAYNLLGTFMGHLPDYYQAKARATIQKALTLDDTLSEAHTSLAKMKMDYDHDWSGAEQEFKRAIQLNPGYSTAHHWYGEVYLSAMGRLRESIAELQIAHEIDPLSTGIITGLAWSYTGLHQYEKAVEECNKALELETQDSSIYLYRAMALMKLSRFDEAIADARRAFEVENTGSNLASLGAIYGVAGKPDETRKILAQIRADPRFKDASPYDLAIVYAALGERDEAFRLLDAQMTTSSVDLLSIRIDPMLDPLRSDARFIELERRFNFPP